VGFRYYAHAQARYRGLNGYVRNLGNGTVEVMVEGERNTLELFAEDLKTGPTTGRVQECQISWLEFDNEFDIFEVRS
jgi:acylphosphatase